MRFAWGLLALGVASLPGGAAEELRILGFASDLPGSSGDDAVAVGNRGSLPTTLDGVRLGDGEGTWTFPPGVTLPPGRFVVVAGDAEAYHAAALAWPDFAATPMGDARPLGAASGQLQLNREGDQVQLWRNETLLDAVAYGASTAPLEGWTGPPIRFAGGAFLRWVARGDGPDTDGAPDFEHPRHRRLGQTALPPLQVRLEGDAWVYTAPEASRYAVWDLLHRATTTLRVNVYDLRDAGFVREVMAQMRAHPGLRVEVLLDEQPVGLDVMERDIRNAVVRELEGAGAVVHVLQHDRYNYNHAKYLVADERFALVQTENLVPSGIPQGPGVGNRGWGVLLEDSQVAEALAQLFDADFTLDPYGARTLSSEETSTLPLPVVSTEQPRAAVPLEELGPGVNASLLIIPDHALGGDDPVLRVIRQAEREIRVEQLQLPPTWRDADGREWPNAYLDALVEAARRGVHVWVLLDGHFDPTKPGGNAHTSTLLTHEGLPGLEARLASDPEDPVLHVKGLLVDNRFALLGSMNWNLNSIAQNREVDVLLESPGAVRFFQDAFEADWARAEASPDAGGSFLMPGPAGSAIILSLTLVAVLMPRKGVPR